jgi:hypothetical protein
MGGASMTFLHILLLLFACAAADLGMSFMQGRVRGARLLLVAPVPAAVVTGVFALTYFTAISVSRFEWAAWTASLMFGVWVAGLLYCVVLALLRQYVRARTQTESGGESNAA